MSDGVEQKDTEDGVGLVRILKSNPSLTSLLKQYSELGVDACLDSGILKDIPFVNSLFAVVNMVGTVRDYRLAKKIIRFLAQLADIPNDERNAMLEQLSEDDKFAGRLGSTLIEMLDRMESDKKPELAAKCFVVFAKGEITYSELRRILWALERVPSFDIDKLADFSRTTFDDLKRMDMDEYVLNAFVNSGFGVNNGGFDGGVIVPTKLCKVYLKVISIP